MAKRPNQRLKLLYLAKIMLRLTDDEHGLQVEQIINELAKYDIAAERKSIYSDLEALQLFGIDIEKKHIGRYVYYCVGNRNLELAELKLLVDAVQSSKFITEKKSSQLIEKLERYVSQYEAKQLNQQVYVHGRIKTMNESIYYNVDEIHNAITADVMISFQYFQWNLKKEMEPRHEGERYIISPWGLIWDNENYYMVGYDAKAELARQLVETRQSTKAVAHLLEEAYPDAEIVYAKARAVSEFRHKFDMIKVREVNDFHHAKDAYLNIVVGNTYYVKFTKDAAWFVRNNPGRTYNLKKMFENETVKRGNETAWIPGDNGTICTVKKWMRKNNVLFTRRAYEVKGGLFDQNILKKGKGQIPIKGGADERLQSIEKYGAYNKASGAYFMLVESDGKKGERKRTIEFVPVYLAKSLEESVELRRRYCEEELGLVNPDVRILKIKINTLFDVDGFKMHLSGRTGKQLLFKGANQLVLSEELQLIVKKIGKYCADYKENKEAVLSEKSEVTQEVLEELYDEFLHKLRNSLYGHRLSAQIEKIEKGKEIFQSMSNEQKCLILMEILHLFQCASQAANLQLIDGPGKAGILVLNNDISKLEDIKIINQSITGFYEQVIDLKTI